MREERLKILTMLQEGKITPEEAERLLAALSGSGSPGSSEWSGRGRRGQGCCDFEFDFTKHIDPEFRRFGNIFDAEFRRKFEEKMRRFRHSMRSADEESRREAGDTLRGAAESVKEAFEHSNIKETVEGIGKTVLDAMEEAMRRFSGASSTGSTGSTGSAGSTAAGGESTKGQTPEEPKGPEGSTSL